MNYINAVDVLPKELLLELSNYVSGELLYIPVKEEKKCWGEKSGSKKYYVERNKEINRQYHSGKSLEQLSETYALSYETIRKIIRK